MKSLVGSKAKEANIPVQQMYGLYAMDQVALKLSRSELANHLIMKGGFLIVTDFGVDQRVTRDLDFSLSNLSLDKQQVDNIITILEERSPEESGYFIFKDVTETREEFEYNGYNVKLNYCNGSMVIPISIDITTGEDLESIHYQRSFVSIFTQQTYQLNSYATEQIITDKLYTLLAYGSIDDTNSRMKDYYDLYLLTKTASSLDLSKVNKGLQKMMKQRDLVVPSEQYQSIIESLMASPKQNQMWAQYCSKNIYAADLSFDEVMTQVLMFAQDLIKQQQLAYTKKQNNLEI